MSINLQDIRLSFRDYLDHKIHVTISTPVPGQNAGSVINPNDVFNFKITATNPTESIGGIALKNVRYRVWVATPQSIKFIVPPVPMIARRRSTPTSEIIPVGNEVTAMYLFPSDERKTLVPGESDSIELTGKALTAGAGRIWFQILAEPDLSYLFPEDDSTAICKVLDVIPV